MGGSKEAIEAHYRLERSLADRLRTAPRDERPKLYGEVYDTLNRESPLYAQTKRAPDPASRARGVAKLIALLNPYLSATTRFLEVGPGDGAVSRAVAARVQSVVAVDVASDAFEGDLLPSNLTRVLTIGSAVPVEAGSVDLAFSHQLMEHLHPDDARDQLEAIFRALAPGGAYLCVTPNRLDGPHDISKHFDEEATGLHLKEYTTGELAHLFESVGFSRVVAIAGTKKRYVALPVGPIRALEWILSRLPRAIRRPLARFWPIRAAIGVCLIGWRRGL